jgi:hypothetical protein
VKKSVEEMMPQYVPALAQHVLAPIIETGPVKVWRMKRPNAGSMEMVEIIVTSLGIVIHGDNHPTDQPVYARNGLDWFVSQLDTGYLASKVLRKQYTTSLQDLRHNTLVTLVRLQDTLRLLPAA